MSDELEALFDELDVTLDSLERSVKTMRSMGAAAREAEHRRASRQLNSIQDIYRSCMTEYEALTRSEKSTWAGKLRDVHARIERAGQELSYVAGAQIDAAAAETAAADGGIVSEGQIMASVLAMGSQDIGSLDRCIRDVGEATEMADAAAEQLEADRERLEAISADVSQIRNDLVLARRHITTFGRRIAGDRMFQVLGLVLVATAVALIIFKFIVK